MASPSQKIGSEAEDQACQYLIQQGLTLVARNWQNRQGEIDLILLDHDDVVFVEVRTRKNDHYGSAIESVSHQKRSRLLRASLHFLQQKNWLERKNVRYDIVRFCNGQLEWIKHAFDLENQ